MVLLSRVVESVCHVDCVGCADVDVRACGTMDDDDDEQHEDDEKELNRCREREGEREIDLVSFSSEVCRDRSLAALCAALVVCQTSLTDTSGRRRTIAGTHDDESQTEEAEEGEYESNMSPPFPSRSSVCRWIHLSMKWLVGQRKVRWDGDDE